MNEPRSGKLLKRDGVSFFLLYGDSIPVLSTEEPVYVFDDKGKLTDWTKDFWADERFQGKWGSGYVWEMSFSAQIYCTRGGWQIVLGAPLRNR